MDFSTNYEKKNKNISIIKSIIGLMCFISFIYIYSSINIIAKEFSFNSHISGYFNVVLFIFGIIGCVISFNKSKKYEIVVIFMTYLMFVWEAWIGQICRDLLGINTYAYASIFSSSFRAIILFMYLYNEGELIRKIVNIKDKRRYLGYFIFHVVVIMSIFFEMKNIKIYNSNIIMYLNMMLIFVYIYTAIKLFVKSIKEARFVYAILGVTIAFFASVEFNDIFTLLGGSTTFRMMSISNSYTGFLIYILATIIEVNETNKEKTIYKEKYKRFFNIVENSKNLNVLILDEEDKISYINQKTTKDFKERYDIDISKYINQDIKELPKHYQSDESYADILEKLLITGHYKGEALIGEEKIIDLYIQILKEANKEYTYIQYSDISEKYINKKLILENEYIKKEEELRNYIFNNISHELKTPINTIYLAEQMLTHKVDSDNFEELYTKYSKVIHINCQRLTRIVNNIIDITKLETNQKTPSTFNYEIISMLEEISMIVNQFAKEKNIKVIFDTDFEELYIECDALMLEKIILNIFSNAIKFTKPGGIINVHVYKCRDNIEISIEDNGIGIDKDMQDKIFDRFVQVDKTITRTNEGSGIGLSISNIMAMKMNGEIKVISDRENGSNFILSLPNRTSSNKEIAEHVVNIENIKLELSDIYEVHNH